MFGCRSTESLLALHARAVQTDSCAKLLEDADGEVLVCQSPCHTAMVYVRRAPVGITRDLEGDHPGGSGTLITLTRAVFILGHSGKTDELAAFLGPIFTSEGSSIELDRLPAGKGMQTSARASFSSGQRLVFTHGDGLAQRKQLRAAEEESRGAVAVYVDSLAGFRAAHDEAVIAASAATKSGRPFCNVDPDRWDKVGAANMFRLRLQDVGLDLEVRSLAHPSCPASRKDLVAAGVPVPVAPAFANWPPLPPLPFESKGIPHSVGTFGESAVQVASQRRTRREDKGQVVVDVGEPSAMHSIEHMRDRREPSERKEGQKPIVGS